MAQQELVWDIPAHALMVHASRTIVEIRYAIMEKRARHVQAIVEHARRQILCAEIMYAMAQKAAPAALEIAEHARPEKHIILLLQVLIAILEQ